jgi:hypothetical protein
MHYLEGYVRERQRAIRRDVADRRVADEHIRRPRLRAAVGHTLVRIGTQLIGPTTPRPSRAA